MAITIKCGSISKRKNSTYQPTDLQLSTEYSVVLKDGCSENNPVFVLNAGSFPYNYVKWDTSYYFVNDVTIDRNNLLTISCSIDVLATFKSNILASSQFVLYDTTANTEIPDTRLSTKTTVTTHANVGSNWTYLGGGSCVILNVVGDSGCDTFAMDLNDAKDLLNDVRSWSATEIPTITYSPGSPESIEEAIEFVFNLIKQTANRLVDTAQLSVANDNAASCIKSAYIFPCSRDRAYGYTAAPLYLGKYPTGKNARRLQIGAYDEQTVNIPWQASDWRKNSPYTQIYMYLPYCGVIEIPASEVSDCSSLTATYDFSYKDGSCVVKVSKKAYDPDHPNDSVETIFKTQINIAGNYAIGTSQANQNGMWNSIFKGAAGMTASALSGNIGGVLSNGSGMFGGIIDNSAMPTSVGGSSGGLLDSQQNVEIMVIYRDTVVAPSSVSPAIGTPTMEYKSLSALTGYVQCSNAKVAAPAHSDELTQIDNYLNSGIYIE